PMGESIQSAIDEVLEGRIDAYAEVVRRYQDEVWRIVAFALRDVAATEDLVQQVFVNAYASLETYRAGMDFGAWLRSIARNLVRSEIRRRMREEKRLKAYHEHLLERVADDKAAERHEARLREALSRCREKLAPTSRRALDLRYRRGLGFGEVAQALGRTAAAARQMLSRVRLELRRCIEGRMARS
ncbi:MAG: RNA polymerase sigma factor, partial [Planctomycetota bacterium]